MVQLIVSGYRQIVNLGNLKVMVMLNLVPLTLLRAPLKLLVDRRSTDGTFDLISLSQEMPAVVAVEVAIVEDEEAVEDSVVDVEGDVVVDLEVDLEVVEEGLMVVEGGLTVVE
jgi:hypothetical protein